MTAIDRDSHPTMKLHSIEDGIEKLRLEIECKLDQIYILEGELNGQNRRV